MKVLKFPQELSKPYEKRLPGTRRLPKTHKKTPRNHRLPKTYKEDSHEPTDSQKTPSDPKGLPENSADSTQGIGTSTLPLWDHKRRMEEGLTPVSIGL